MKGLTTKQADYVYSKCKNEQITCTEHLYDCDLNNDETVDSKLNPYEGAMFNDFELYNIYPESAEIEKWSILNTQVDYV